MSFQDFDGLSVCDISFFLFFFLFFVRSDVFLVLHLFSCSFTAILYTA